MVHRVSAALPFSVSPSARQLPMRLLPEMVGQLHLERSFHRRLVGLRDEPPGPTISSCVLAPPTARQPVLDGTLGGRRSRADACCCRGSDGR